MTLVALATAADLTLPDTETEVVAAALRRDGVDAAVATWDGSFDWSSADLVVVRSTWDYVHRLDEFLAWIDRAAAVATVVNPAAVLRWNVHKRYLAELTAAGLPVVPTVLVQRGTAVDAIGPLASGATDVVVKPAVSASAYGTARGRVDDPALAAHLRDLVATADVLVQPLVPSVLTEGEVSLVYLGGELSHAVRKLAKPGDYRVQQEHGGTVRPHTATPDEVAVAEAALAAVPGPCTYARVDVVAGPRGPLLMEIELIEPQLFLDQAPGSASRFATALLAPGNLRP